MDDLIIKKDGVVAHWFRWHLLAVSSFTIMNYIVYGVSLLFKGRPLAEIYDPKLLLFTIPIGILLGDSLYEKDRAANEKPIEKSL